MNGAGISFSMDVTAYDRGTYWAGMIEQMGTFVYADTMDALRERVSETVDFFVNCFESREEMVDYFDRRGVLYTRHESASPARSSVWSLLLDDERNAIDLDARERRLSIRQDSLVPA